MSADLEPYVTLAASALGISPPEGAIAIIAAQLETLMAMAALVDAAPFERDEAPLDTFHP